MKLYTKIVSHTSSETQQVQQNNSDSRGWLSPSTIYSDMTNINNYLDNVHCPAMIPVLHNDQKYHCPYDIAQLLHHHDDHHDDEKIKFEKQTNNISKSSSISISTETSCPCTANNIIQDSKLMQRQSLSPF